MCRYITAAIPPRTDLRRLEAAAARHGLRFAPLANAFVQAQLPPGAAYMEKGSACCDCATVLGSLGAGCGGRRADGAGTSELAKRRRASWSEQKLARWLADRARTQEKRARHAGDVGRERRHEAREWLAFLHDALASGLPYLGLLLHFYRLTPSNERIQFERSESIPVANLTEGALMRLEEDVLYLFHR